MARGGAARLNDLPIVCLQLLSVQSIYNFSPLPYKVSKDFAVSTQFNFFYILSNTLLSKTTPKVSILLAIKDKKNIASAMVLAIMYSL